MIGNSFRCSEIPEHFGSQRAMLGLVLLALTFLLLLSDCKSREPGEDRFTDIRSDVLEFMENENVPSVSVAVAQHGRIVWEESFGWANRERRIKATPHTRYELASVAKVFTTTGLMVLRERGVINMDMPIDLYLGNLRIKAFGVDPSGVTLRRILQHTSGLPMYWGEPACPETLKSYSRKQILERYAILAMPPGEREIYSNLGISMAVYVLEQVSGSPFGAFLQKEIFLPLGMRNSSYLSTPPTSDDYAQQYTKDGLRWDYPEGMYSSAHDLLRFGMFHLKDNLPDQGSILSDSTIDLMQTSIDSMSDFRLPWWVWEYKGFLALVFTGASGTIMALVPEADLAIVVLANRLLADTPRICGWIADVMLDNFDESRRLSIRVKAHRKIRPGRMSPAELAGVWKGAIRAGGKVIPVEIRFEDIGPPHMRAMNDGVSWGTWVETMPSLRGDYSAGIFTAYFPIRIPIEDTRAHDHWTWLYVAQKADTLHGYAVAHAADGPHFGLPYYIKVVRDRFGSAN
jgi:CubicO group peptidase (beta-lactamase class C family)